jgi:hypothetical protein
LQWNAPAAADLAFYSVYKNGVLISTVTLPTYSDAIVAAGDTYHITATDTNGNESARSSNVVPIPAAAPPSKDNRCFIATAAYGSYQAPNGYEELMVTPDKWRVTGTTNLQRYSFIFKANKTVNASDPVTLDNGARIYFHNIFPGKSVTVANLDLVPLSANNVTFRSHILINPTSKTLALQCPDGTNTVLCGEYVRFSDSQPITWPYTVPPHGSDIIYSLDNSLIVSDKDGDGIPDYQDTCNATPISQAVNATGCGLGE